MPAKSDRPWPRKLVKHGFQVLAGRARAHGQDVWPHLALEKPQGGAPGHILWRRAAVGALLPLADVQGLIADGQVLICGSGPSAAQADPARWVGGPVVLLNGALSLASSFTTSVVAAIEDERFVWRHRPMIAAAEPIVSLWLLSPSVLRALLSLSPDWAQGRRIFLIDDLAKPVNGRRRRLDDPALAACFAGQTEPRVSLRPDIGVVPVGTVGFSAAQIALGAGAPAIGFLGVDLGSAAGPRFYEKAGDQAKSGILDAMESILAHFAALMRVAEANGVALRCHSATSALLGLGIARDASLDLTDG